MLLIGHYFLPFCFPCGWKPLSFPIHYLYHLSIKEINLRILLVAVYIASFSLLCVVFILILGEVQFTKSLIKIDKFRIPRLSWDEGLLAA